jgi:hypothetical protein
MRRKRGPLTLLGNSKFFKTVKFKNPRKLDCCSLLDRFFYSTDDSHEGDRVEQSLFHP